MTEPTTSSSSSTLTSGSSSSGLNSTSSVPDASISSTFGSSAVAIPTHKFVDFGAEPYICSPIDPFLKLFIVYGTYEPCTWQHYYTQSYDLRLKYPHIRKLIDLCGNIELDSREHDYSQQCGPRIRKWIPIQLFDLYGTNELCGSQCNHIE
ncbi:hypothetical protein KC319_g12813 [Hortaea werneckii]|nr:hypothetical protein KC352_g9853 [Hortaea werneckii]KAI7555610.1 hypothetical protein KC317_g12828 [Hortaea werneckii]KAI7601969.1 hypothetical protein KC346_g12570 [Hortaea werneckii]KAI7643038.1 hypothetical protein KC319_g12813 [Hortaea werneckii]KAI7704979.1 hypothetical protein KC322_g6458 [Hortaea werneckii]